MTAIVTAPIRRVLVVEDDALVRTVVGHALRLRGLDADGVDSGAAALARLAADPPVDAVLVDGLLPDMHGAVLVRQLLADPATAGLPVCMLTGAAARSTAADAGLRCLVKPATPRAIGDAVVELLAWRDAGGSPIEERRSALDHLEEIVLVGRRQRPWDRPA